MSFRFWRGRAGRPNQGCTIRPQLDPAIRVLEDVDVAMDRLAVGWLARGGQAPRRRCVRRHIVIGVARGRLKGLR